MLQKDNGVYFNRADDLEKAVIKIYMYFFRMLKTFLFFSLVFNFNHRYSRLLVYIKTRRRFGYIKIKFTDELENKNEQLTNFLKRAKDNELFKVLEKMADK